MICALPNLTLPYLMLYKHVFYLNGLSKESFRKLLAFACVYVCIIWY